MAEENISNVRCRAIMIDDKLWGEIRAEGQRRGINNISATLRALLVENLNEIKAKNGGS